MKQVVKEDCIFCKLSMGEIPTNAIYEDDAFKVIMDMSPASKGHCIILPKTHAANLFELPEEYAQKVMMVAKRCGEAMTKVLKCDGINVLQNNGEAAGQTVFHYHVHLIPRYQGDKVNISWDAKEAEYDLSSLAEEIRAGF